jgi:recombinational DNA repair ATPase RecF
VRLIEASLSGFRNLAEPDSPARVNVFGANGQGKTNCSRR